MKQHCRPEDSNVNNLSHVDNRETDDLRLKSDVDLEAVLAAWHTATQRLQQTHETLSAEVRRLSDELESKNRQLARKNRLADLGQMASHVAHEVRNNLMPMTLYLSLLGRRVSGDNATKEIMEKIEASFTALEATVNDLLHFTSDRDPQIQPFDLPDLINEVCDSLQPQFAAQEIHLDIDSCPSHQIVADRDMFRRALLNLVLNGLDAMPDGGELTITSYMTGGHLELEVADSGCGVPASIKPRLFEPFYTTKSSGTGLGLAIVYRIAEVHGGRIECIDCPEGGTAFTLRIPSQVQTRAA